MKELKEVADDYISTVLTMLGVPDISFDYADPMAVLAVFIFSTELLTFALAVVLWGVMAFFKSSSDKWGIKEQQKKRENDDIKSYDYHGADMKQMSKANKMGNIHQMGGMDKMKQGPSVLSTIMTKFVFPVVIIFIVLSFAMSMLGVG